MHVYKLIINNATNIILLYIIIIACVLDLYVLCFKMSLSNLSLIDIMNAVNLINYPHRELHLDVGYHSGHVQYSASVSIHNVVWWSY